MLFLLQTADKPPINRRYYAASNADNIFDKPIDPRNALHSGAIAQS